MSLYMEEQNDRVIVEMSKQEREDCLADLVERVQYGDLTGAKRILKINGFKETADEPEDD